MVDKKKSGKSTWIKIAVVAFILLMIAGIPVYKSYSAAEPPKNTAVQDISGQKLPRLVELGSGTCVPCRRMAPIIEELKKEYEGRVIVEVIDVYEQSEEAAQYGIKVIPTQILFDAEGKEAGRHEGFIAKEDLVKAFEMVGVK